jgi:hypothetical protein
MRIFRKEAQQDYNVILKEKDFSSIRARKTEDRFFNPNLKKSNRTNTASGTRSKVQMLNLTNSRTQAGSLAITSKKKFYSGFYSEDLDC